jgi:hypothetical protein
MKKRPSLFRADVTRSLKEHATSFDAAQRRLRLSAGVYNVQPWGYALGVLGALFAVLFATYAAIRYGERNERLYTPNPSAQQPAPAATEIYVPIELE